MKKTLFFLITVLLEVFFFAQGESENNMYGIKELQNQRRSWNESYEAKGRTVQVDIPIIVPEVEEFPVFSVEPYYAVYEQRLTRDGTMLEKIGEDGWCSVYAESNLLLEEGIIGKARVLDLDDFEQVDFDANYSSPRDEHMIRKGKMENVYSMELGYVVYGEEGQAYQEQENTKFVLVPTWLVRGCYARKDKVDYGIQMTDETFDYMKLPGFQAILIDAQTGEVRNLRKPTESECYMPKIKQ